jgi:hypothetical protein
LLRFSKIISPFGELARLVKARPRLKAPGVEERQSPHSPRWAVDPTDV